MTMDQEVRYRHPGPAGEGVSNVEVENVMKMLMAYQKARAEGIGQPNPELDVSFPPYHLLANTSTFSLHAFRYWTYQTMFTI